MGLEHEFEGYKDLSKELEARSTILALQGQILDEKELLLKANEEILNLKWENQCLKEKLRARDELANVEWENGYWIVKDEGRPICPNCLRNQKQIIVLSDIGNEGLLCKSCQYGTGKQASNADE